MGKPDPIDISEIVRSQLGRFARHELWISDSIADFLSNRKATNLSYTTVVVDTDDDLPVSKIENGFVYLNMHGRFYPPETDKNGDRLAVSFDEWKDLISDWFSQHLPDLEIKFADGDPDLARFTFGYPAIGIPPNLGDESSVEENQEELELEPELEPEPEEINQEETSEEESSEEEPLQ